MQSWNATFFLFFFCYSLWGTGRVRALNLTVPLGSGRVGSGQTISGTGRVRASVLSPCRALVRLCVVVPGSQHKVPSVEALFCLPLPPSLCPSLFHTVQPLFIYLFIYLFIFPIFPSFASYCILFSISCFLLILSSSCFLFLPSFLLFKFIFYFLMSFLVSYIFPYSFVSISFLDSLAWSIFLLSFANSHFFI